MASIDKLTVRNEVSRLKTDFDQIYTDGEIKKELKVLMNSMFMIIELMLSIFLEKVESEFLLHLVHFICTKHKVNKQVIKNVE